MSRHILVLGDASAGKSKQGIQAYIARIWEQIKTRAFYWKQLYTISVLVAFLYILMEWLFFVTMPSFMSLMSFFNKTDIFLLSGWGFALFCLLLLAAFIIVDFLGLILRIAAVTRYGGLAIPAIILAAGALLLIDNFTYTIFKFGISTVDGIARGAYAVLFILLFIYAYLRLLKLTSVNVDKQAVQRGFNRWFYVSVGMMAVVSGLVFANIRFNNIFANDATLGEQSIAKLPNILLLGSDGLDASNLSVYGYSRDTTPRLKELAQSSLVAENAFTNAGKTTGSVISIMTSKLPTQTRVLYPPDILTGIDAFQHLPGMLNNLGYKTVEFGVPYYIDAYNFNLQDGFDIVNGRSMPVGKFSAIGRKLGFENEVYFLTQLTERISDRILHIFYVRKMENPYTLVTQPVANLNDETKISQALTLFDQSTSSLFIHIHLLGTHGGYYSPKVRVYSKGEGQPQPWMTDFYDDTLLDFDAYVGSIIDHLKADGQFDNTILIIYTDHNKEFKVTERIPLIIHFPNGSQAGVITQNVENMDIAPTILDYLGLTQPTWMEGESLLKSDTLGQRLIFSLGTEKTANNEQKIFVLDPNLVKPPFYQFSFINVVDCQKWYTFDLETHTWTSGDVNGYVNPCNAQDLLSMAQIKQAVYQRLAQDGFDISSLP